MLCANLTHETLSAARQGRTMTASAPASFFDFDKAYISRYRVANMKLRFTGETQCTGPNTAAAACAAPDRWVRNAGFAMQGSQ
jgi:hypothetical protein